jgi:hypothetical protein
MDDFGGELGRLLALTKEQNEPLTEEEIAEASALALRTGCLYIGCLAAMDMPLPVTVALMPRIHSAAIAYAVANVLQSRPASSKHFSEVCADMAAEIRKTWGAKREGANN